MPQIKKDTSKEKYNLLENLMPKKVIVLDMKK